MNAVEKRLIAQLSQRLVEIGVQDDQASVLIEKLLHDTQPKRASTPIKRGGSLRPRSAKRERQYESCRLAREKYLKKHPNCEVRGCKRPSCDIHHKAKRNGQRLTDQKYWMAVCRECHSYIGNNPAWAYQQGYLEPVIRRND